MFDRAKRVTAQIKQAEKPEQLSNQTQEQHMTLTVDEMAHELNISRATAYKLVQVPGFPSFTIGQRVVIDRQGLCDWVRQQWDKPTILSQGN